MSTQKLSKEFIISGEDVEAYWLNLVFFMSLKSVSMNYVLDRATYININSQRWMLALYSPNVTI